MTDAVALQPDLTVLLPEGWVAIHFDDRADDELRRVVSDVMLTVAPDKRDMARARLRGMLQSVVMQSRERGLFEVWLPVAETAGIHIPASIVVGPLPSQPSATVPVNEVLLSLSAASPGARAVTVGRVLAVRIVTDRGVQRDPAGEVTAPAARVVSFIVSPIAPEQPWLTVTASLFVPDVDGSSEIVEAMEFLVDSLVATVQFVPKGGGTS